MEIGTIELVSPPDVSSLLGGCRENSLSLGFISFSRGSVASLDKSPLDWGTRVTRLSMEKSIELFCEIAESKKAVENSPFLEKLKKKGRGVLYMVAMVFLLLIVFVDGRTRQRQDKFKKTRNQDRVREFHLMAKVVVHYGGSKSVKRAWLSDAVDKKLKFPKKEDLDIKVIDVNDKGNHFFDFYLAEIEFVGGKCEMKNIIHFGSFINVVVIVCDANFEFEDAHGDICFMERLLSECHDDFGKPCLEVKYECCKAKSQEFLGSRVCGNYLKNAEKCLTVLKVTYTVSNGASTTVYESINVCSTLTCARIEEFNLDLFRKGMKPFENCLRMAKIEMTSAYHVILVDSSTHIPTVQLILQDIFKGKNLCNSVNDNEAFTYDGAARAVSLINDFGVYANSALNVVAEDNTMRHKKRITITNNKDCPETKGPSSYSLWCKKETYFEKPNSEAIFKESSNILGTKWKSLSAENKKPYKEKDHEKKEAYLHVISKEKLQKMSVENSAILEKLKKDYEFLCLINVIDEYTMGQKVSRVIRNNLNWIFCNILQGTRAFIYWLFMSWALRLCRLALCCTLAAVNFVYGLYQKKTVKLIQEITYSLMGIVRVYGTEKQEFSIGAWVQCFEWGSLHKWTELNPKVHLEDKVSSIGGGIDKSASDVAMLERGPNWMSLRVKRMKEELVLGHSGFSLIRMEMSDEEPAEMGQLELEITQENTAGIMRRNQNTHLEDKVKLKGGSIDKLSVTLALGKKEARKKLGGKRLWLLQRVPLRLTSLCY